jgi:uncharacterized cupredoxin-like copper-binding protein
MNTRAPLVALLAAAALAGCGGDNNNNDNSTSEPASTPSGGGSAQTLELTAEEPGGGKFAFDAKTLDAKAGEVTIDLSVPDGLASPHAIELEGNGVEETGETVTAGGTSSVTADLKPGKYEFYCPVDGHRQLGMEGTLTVG